MNDFCVIFFFSFPNIIIQDEQFIDEIPSRKVCEMQRFLALVSEKQNNKHVIQISDLCKELSNGKVFCSC